MSRGIRAVGYPANRGMRARHASGSIDRHYYERSGYFGGGGGHLQDPESRFHRYRVREVLNLCGDPSGVRAVDLGCGWGTISFALSGRAEFIVGVDFARASLKVCASRHDPDEHPNLAFVQTDARLTGLRGEAWDLVVAADLVEHLYPHDTEAVYREVWRLLRPNGRFVVWTPSPTHLVERLRRIGILTPDPTHVDYKTLDRIRTDLVRFGFRIVNARHVPSHHPALHTIERIGQRWIPSLRRRIAVAAEKPERTVPPASSRGGTR